VSHNPSPPFTRASLFLGPLLEAYGFRLVAREYDEDPEGGASAEYLLGELRLRLLHEPEAQALWIEAARQSGGSIISRWIDIEWTVAGQRLPLNSDLSDARLDQLAEALAAFLAPERRSD
jgi:hypothetical protein